MQTETAKAARLDAASRLLDAARLLIACEDHDLHPADTRWKTARRELRRAVADLSTTEPKNAD